MKRFALLMGGFLFTAGIFLPQQSIAQPGNPDESVYSTDRVTAFRVRADFAMDLDEDLGWADTLNKAPAQLVDHPFRIRFEVESDTSFYRRQFSLQYSWNNRPWQYVEAQEFPYPSAASPPVSIVSCKAFFYGEEADDLIAVCWADGPQVVTDGDRFSLRMVDHLGRPLTGPMPEFLANVPKGHLGGTFVETPARIGPYENSKGDLYFIMEPTETDNVFMMVKSTDVGQSWFEVDADNRPKVSDLEGLGSVMSKDGVIHIAHQISEGVYRMKNRLCKQQILLSAPTAAW